MTQSLGERRDLDLRGRRITEPFHGWNEASNEIRNRLEEIRTRRAAADKGMAYRTRIAQNSTQNPGV